jgi:hypothetical protein
MAARKKATTRKSNQKMLTVRCYAIIDTDGMAAVAGRCAEGGEPVCWSNVSQAALEFAWNEDVVSERGAGERIPFEIQIPMPEIANETPRFVAVIQEKTNAE